MVGSTLTSTQVQADGTYDLLGLPTGTYRVEFDDYPGGGYLGEFYDDATTLDAASDIAVTAGAITGDVDSRLSSGGHIAGTVTDAAGTSVAGVNVAAYINDRGSWHYVTETKTRADGTYTVAGLLDGTYRLQFGVEGVYTGYLTEYYDDVSTIAAATDIAVTDGITESGIDAQLAPDPPTSITGTVSGAGGVLLGDVQVTAYKVVGTAGYVPFGDVLTAADGTYDLRLPPGGYRLGFSDYSGAGYAPEFFDNATTLDGAAIVGTASVVNARLVLGGHIAGKVTGTHGTPLAGISVCAYYWGSIAGEEYWQSRCGARTDGDGTYDIGFLPADTYRLGFYDSTRAGYRREYWKNARTVEAAHDIVVRAGATVGGKNARLTRQHRAH